MDVHEGPGLGDDSHLGHPGEHLANKGGAAAGGHVKQSDAAVLEWGKVVLVVVIFLLAVFCSNSAFSHFLLLQQQQQQQKHHPKSHRGIPHAVCQPVECLMGHDDQLMGLQELQQEGERERLRVINVVL